ncbi:MAG: sugar MFS transporter [Bacteroidota bacterium]
MNSYKYSLIVITSLFFMWGFLTCMNDILIPHLKAVFDLKYWQAMLIQFAFFGAYFVGSVIYFVISTRLGDPINKIGYKNGLIIGLLISALGCFLFYPAAEFVVFGFFLGALFILGLGFTMLQIAANPYVSILGPESSASSRLNLSQAFNSFGTTIAPLIGGYLIFEFFFDENTSGADAVKVPYLIFGALFILLAGVVSRAALPAFSNEEQLEKGLGVLKYPHLVFGILAIFTYVGGEVTIGSFIINFIGLDEIAGMEEARAANFLAFYWGGAMIGRFLGAISLSTIEHKRKGVLMVITSFATFFILFGLLWGKATLLGELFDLTFQDLLPYLGFLLLNLLCFKLGNSMPGRTLGIFAITNVVLILTSMLVNGELAMWTLLGVGLFNSIMWPNIFTLAIKGLGKYTSQGSSLLVMAILGGALVPVFQGFLADAISLRYSFFLPIMCYLYIMFYGFKWSKSGNS